jgi:ABC-type amino acid transport substrate-binding protein
VSLARPLFLVALVTAVASTASMVSASDLEALKARGTLRALMTKEDYPEWFSLSGGPDPGFERELLEGFTQLHRLKLEIVFVPAFDATIPALRAGRGDLIPGIIDTAARRKQITFTAEVLPSRHVAVGLGRHGAPRTVEELRGRKVAVVAGTTWAEVARQHVPAAQLVSYARADEVWAALHAGTATATVVVLSEYLSARRHEPDLVTGVFLGERVSAAWGVRPGDTELLAALDDYLSLKRQSMGFARLVVKYFGPDATTILDRAGH